jgi:hypothetical protein
MGSPSHWSNEHEFWAFHAPKKIGQIIREEAERQHAAGKTPALNFSRAIRTLIKRADRLAKEAAAKK